MNTKAYSWAWTQENLTAQQKLILLALAFLCNEDTNTLSPSTGRIARLVGIAEPTVRRALKALVELGLISREVRTEHDGATLPNAYTFIFPQA